MRHGLAGEFALRDEAAGRSGGQSKTVGGRLAARHQNNSRRIVKGCDPLRYDEAIHIWQLDIEDDHIGPQPYRLRDSTEPIRGLANDFEAMRLEQRSGRTPELLVVIHDEQSEWHAFIITNDKWERIVVSTKGT